MQFLRPTSTQFPFDAACADVVSALETRNFAVPGLRVQFRTYGTGEQRMRFVRVIEGDDFRIDFGRDQGYLSDGRYFDCAACAEIAIPRKKIRVYSDGSGATFYLYVGGDWAADRAAFLRGPGVLAKLHGEPRTYLEYRGGDWRFVACDDGREYAPTWAEPRTLMSSEVFTEFVAYVRNTVLPAIEAHPRAEIRVDPLIDPPLTPIPEGVGSLFCFGNAQDAHRIREGKVDPSQLCAADRYGMQPHGFRLVPFGSGSDDALPKVAYEGFLWCGRGEATTPPALDGSTHPIPMRLLRIPGHDGYGECCVIRVTPKWADGVYVADQAPYDRRRAEIAQEARAQAVPRGGKPRGQYTKAEIDDFVRARGRTIVSIVDYRGGYANPVFLIGRELALDEVELVGPDRRDHADIYGW